MSIEKDTEILIVDESPIASVIRDTYTFGCFMAVVSVGAWLGSSAMQWIAGFAWVFWTIGRAASMFKDKRRRSPQQAAEYLAERYGARA